MKTTSPDRGHERTLFPTPAAVGLARDIVDQQLVSWGLGDMAELRQNAAQITAELVENARRVSPTHGTIKVRTVLNEEGLTISVWDQSTDRPETDWHEISLEEIDALPEDHEFGGWGLSIVEQLCERVCGVRTIWPVGKWVWARLKVTG